MMKLPDLELVACTGCEHHFARPPGRHNLPCNDCGAAVVALPLYVDVFDIAGLPIAQPAPALEVA